MFRPQLISDGGYFSDGQRSFIQVKPQSRLKVIFIAYCADFEKDNPDQWENFTVSQLPESLKTVMQNITHYAKQNPNIDFTSAAQVAVWLTQGETSDEIKKKFNFTSQDEKLARSFLK